MTVLVQALITAVEQALDLQAHSMMTCGHITEVPATGSMLQER